MNINNEWVQMSHWKLIGFCLFDDNMKNNSLCLTFPLLLLNTCTVLTELWWVHQLLSCPRCYVGGSNQKHPLCPSVFWIIYLQRSSSGWSGWAGFRLRRGYVSWTRAHNIALSSVFCSLRALKDSRWVKASHWCQDIFERWLVSV